MTRVVFLALAMALLQPWVPIARAQVPPGARTYGPVLAERQRALWADAPVPWTLAGLIEQESCITLKHPKCWNPRAELKTSREYGFGLGQVTVAYNKDGSERFNKFAELKAQYASLRGWTWADRYNPTYQLAAIIEMSHALWRRFDSMQCRSTDDHWAFVLSSYNGGAGSVLQDRRYCANSPHCDPTQWFGHVETHSLKSKQPQPEYRGESWYSINRGYVRNVLTVRRAKYEVLWR